MRKKLVISLGLLVLLSAGVVVWYPKQNIPAVSTAADTLDISALEKELGIEITEIDPPTSNIDTSDWKTYRNEEFGFEVKYPGEWGIVDTDRLESDVKFIKTFSYNSGLPGADEATGLFIITIKENFSIKNWVKIILSDGDVLDSIEHFVKSDGMGVLRVHETAEGGSYSPYLHFFEKSDHVYLMMGSDGTIEDGIIQAIFSTLTFF